MGPVCGKVLQLFHMLRTHCDQHDCLRNVATKHVAQIFVDNWLESLGSRVCGMPVTHKRSRNINLATLLVQNSILSSLYYLDPAFFVSLVYSAIHSVRWHLSLHLTLFSANLLISFFVTSQICIRHMYVSIITQRSINRSRCSLKFAK